MCTVELLSPSSGSESLRTSTVTLHLFYPPTHPVLSLHVMLISYSSFSLWDMFVAQTFSLRHHNICDSAWTTLSILKVRGIYQMVKYSDITSTNLLSCYNDPKCLHWIYEALDLLVDSLCSTGSLSLLSAYGNIKTCFTLKILFLYVWKMHSVAGSHAWLSEAFLLRNTAACVEVELLRQKFQGVLLKCGLMHSTDLMRWHINSM